LRVTDLKKTTGFNLNLADFYTLKGSKFPRVELWLVVLKLVTRGLTENFNQDQYI